MDILHLPEKEGAALCRQSGGTHCHSRRVTEGSLPPCQLWVVCESDESRGQGSVAGIHGKHSRQDIPDQQTGYSSGGVEKTMSKW